MCGHKSGNLTTVSDAEIMLLERHATCVGDLVVGTKFSNAFEAKRVFYLYDIPAGKSRGAHAHKECHQLLVAVSGSFQVELTDGRNQKTVHLNQPHLGLHIPPGLWAAEKNFSGGSICLVLASHEYDESDYLRDYEGFLSWKDTHPIRLGK